MIHLDSRLKYLRIIYTQLIAALKKRFTPTTSLFELRFHLRRRRQKEAESFDTFAEELSRQAAKAFPDLTDAARLEVVRDQFIERIRNEYIQERLLQEAPEIMEKVAKQLSAAKAAQRNLKESASPTPGSIHSISEGFDLHRSPRCEEVFRKH